MSNYVCGKHGEYTPIFDRIIKEKECPRIICEKCEEDSYKDPEKRPKNIPYFYKGNKKAVLTEAHYGSAVWQFDPPVIYPEWHFDKELNPVVAENAKTPEEIMEQMEAMLPEIERICKENGVNIPDPRDLFIVPGRNMRVRE